MTGMHMRTTPSTSGNTAVVGKCAFFKLSVYWNDGTPVTTLRPYLNAAGRFLNRQINFVSAFHDDCRRWWTLSCSRLLFT